MIYFRALSALGHLLPSIISFIEFIEGKLGPQTGEAKKKAVLEFLTKLLESGSSLIPGITPELSSAILSVAGFVIDGVISALNLVGIFKKSPASPVAP